MKNIFGISILFIFSLSSMAQVKMQKSDGGLLFSEDGENVLFYQVDPKSHNGTYRRCNYIHPLWGIDGNVLTEDFPADHLHQRGVYWAWHQIWIGDKRIGDGWEIKDYEQNIAEVEFVARQDNSAVLKTEVYWESDLWKKDGKKVPYMKENATVTIHSKVGNYRKIDFEIKLLALTEDLSIGGSEDVKGYSGFSVRMILPDDVEFDGPDGKVTPENTAVKSNGYVNVSGTFGKNENSGGVVILDNPQNPGYPQQWILRKKNSMQNPVYPGRQAVAVSITEPIVLKYSLLVYSGKMNNNKIERIINLK